jgi:hypothetical protein
MNLKANLVDIVVRVGLVMLAYFAGMELRPEHVVLTCLYVVWLLFVKPRTSELAEELQALIAVFLGTTVAVTGAMLLGEMGVSLDMQALMVVLMSFVIGYGSLRHILSQTEDYKFDLTTLGWGLVMAELGWILYHRAIIYYFGDVIIPQAAVVMTLASFLFFRVSRSLVQHGGKVSMRELVAPMVFVALVLVTIFLLFNGQRFSY